MIVCEHTHPADCHNLREYVCPDHFQTLLSQLTCGVAAGDQRQALHALGHLAEHEWMGQAVYTMCGLLQVCAPRPGETQEQTLARMPVPTDRTRADYPWKFRAAVLARSAVVGDGATIAATLKSIGGDDPMPHHAITSLFMSLANATHRAVEMCDKATVYTVATIMAFGSQVYRAEAYNLLAPVSLLADSLRLGIDVPQHAKDRMFAATGTELVAAVGMCGLTLGQLVNPDGPEVVLTASRDKPWDNICGILNWQDESQDPGRGDKERAVAQAIRLATAYASGDPDRPLALYLPHDLADTAYEYAIDVIAGTCSVITAMMSDQGHSHGV